MSVSHHTLAYHRTLSHAATYTTPWPGAAAWLDLDGEQYERLDRYFAAARTGDAR